MDAKPFSQRLNSRVLIAVCICAFLAICFWPRNATDSLNVPLGVEHSQRAGIHAADHEARGGNTRVTAPAVRRTGARGARASGGLGGA